WGTPSRHMRAPILRIVRRLRCQISERWCLLPQPQLRKPTTPARLRTLPQGSIVGVTQIPRCNVLSATRWQKAPLAPVFLRNLESADRNAVGPIELLGLSTITKQEASTTSSAASVARRFAVAVAVWATCRLHRAKQL